MCQAEAESAVCMDWVWSDTSQPISWPLDWCVSPDYINFRVSVLFLRSMLTCQGEIGISWSVSKSMQSENTNLAVWSVNNRPSHIPPWRRESAGSLPSTGQIYLLCHLRDVDSWMNFTYYYRTVVLKLASGTYSTFSSFRLSRSHIECLFAIHHSFVFALILAFS